MRHRERACCQPADDGSACRGSRWSRVSRRMAAAGGGADVKSQGVMCGLFKQPLGGRVGEVFRPASALISHTRAHARTHARRLSLILFFFKCNPSD